VNISCVYNILNDTRVICRAASARLHFCETGRLCKSNIWSRAVRAKPWSHRPPRLNSTKLFCWVESGRAMWSRLYVPRDVLAYNSKLRANIHSDDSGGMIYMSGTRYSTGKEWQCRSTWYSGLRCKERLYMHAMDWQAVIMRQLCRHYNIYYC